MTLDSSPLTFFSFFSFFSFGAFGGMLLLYQFTRVEFNVVTIHEHATPSFCRSPRNRLNRISTGGQFQWPAAFEWRSAAAVELSAQPPYDAYFDGYPRGWETRRRRRVAVGLGRSTVNGPNRRVKDKEKAFDIAKQLKGNHV